ncbi:MAG: transcription antitermination factor NusB [Pseudomonadota bacterium]
MVDEVRKAAWALVAAVGEGRLLSELLPDAVEHLPEAGRARAGRLAHETLRWSQRADRVLGPYLRKKPYPLTHDMLRMAVWELCADCGAPHGVINSAVTLLRNNPDTRRQSGLANAVLRRVAKAEVKWDDLPAPSLPKWLRKPLLAAYGKAAVGAMEAAHAVGAPLDLTLRDGPDKALTEALEAEVLPTGSLRLRGSRRVTALPGYEDGRWWVQDAAAALPVRALAPKPGEQVLDLCAAPGGKTMQLAAAGAQVTALDVSAARMGRVEENLKRTGLTAKLVVADALKWAPEAPFEAVLLDAPCSATGTIRRHPDLPHAKDGSGFEELYKLQAALIDRAAEWLTPGGRLVYCTCSLLPEEGEAQAAAAIERTALQAVSVDVPGISPEWITPNGYLRLRPDYWAERGGMDGFFIAVLQKPA